MAQVKVTLGNRPKNFPKTVKFPMLEGGEGAIKASYIYRTRKEFGQLIDARVQAARDAAAEQATAEPVAVDPALAADFSMATFLGDDTAKRASYLMEIMDGWNLDEPFSLAAVLQLCDELPAASTALINDYAAAVREGHLGN